jgi:hypothetical protein
MTLKLIIKWLLPIAHNTPLLPSVVIVIIVFVFNVDMDAIVWHEVKFVEGEPPETGRVHGSVVLGTYGVVGLIGENYFCVKTTGKLLKKCTLGFFKIRNNDGKAV